MMSKRILATILLILVCLNDIQTLQSEDKEEVVKLVQSSIARENESPKKSEVPHTGVETAATKELLKKRLERFKAAVKKTHKLENVVKESEVRKRRELLEPIDAPKFGTVKPDLNHYDAESGIYFANKLTRIKPQPFEFVETEDIAALDFLGDTQILSIEIHKHAWQFVVSKLDKALVINEVYRAAIPWLTTIDVAEINKKYYLVCSVRNYTNALYDLPYEHGVIIYQYNPVSYKFFEVQVIPSDGPTISQFWKGSGDGTKDAYLTIAPEYTHHGDKLQYDVNVQFYRWQGGYFDYVSSTRAIKPTAITHFSIYSMEYVGVANYQNIQGARKTYSEILKYNHKETSYVSFQRIATSGAVDMAHFILPYGQKTDHFLVIANHCEDYHGKLNYLVKSVIMKFVDDRFVPFQSFLTFGALSILPVLHDEIFYLVVAELTGLRIFQYNGWNFVETELLKYARPLSVENENHFRLKPFIHKNFPYFLVSTSYNVPNGIHKVDFVYKQDYKSIMGKFETWCSNALSKLKHIDTTQIVQKAENAPKLGDKTIHVGNGTKFTNEVRLNVLNSEALSYGNYSFDNRLAILLAGKGQQIDDLRQRLKMLVEKLGNIVLRDRTTKVLGPIKFRKLIFKNANVGAYQLNVTSTLNGLDVNRLWKGLIFLHKNYSFKNLIIGGTLYASKDIEASFLNKFPMEDYAVKYGANQMIFKHDNIFTQGFTVDTELQCLGNIAGFNFSRKDYLLKDVNQTFGDPMKLKYSQIDKLETKLYNGYDLNYYLKFGVPKDGDAVIVAPKLFKDFIANKFDTNQPISGVDVDHIMKNAIFTKGQDHHHIENATFESLYAKSVEMKHKKINSVLDLDKDLAKSSNESYNFQTLVLKDNTFIKHLRVVRKLNEIVVDEMGELNVVLRQSPRTQHICNKTFEEVVFRDNITALDYFDGVNISSWSPMMELTVEEDIVKMNVKGSITVGEGMTVNYGMQHDGHEVLDVIEESSYEVPSSIPGTCDLVFENLRVLGNAETITELNGLSPSDWIRKNSSHTKNITGKKTFGKDVFFEANMRTNAMYGEKVVDPNSEVFSTLKEVLIDGVDQEVGGNWLFMNKLEVKRLTCPKVTLNDVDFDHILFKDDSELKTVEIPTTVEADIIVHDKLKIKILESKKVEGKDFKEEVEDTLRTKLESSQMVIGRYSFEDELKIDHLKIDGKIIGQDASTLLTGIIRKDYESEQVINGHLYFEYPAKIDLLDYSGFMNEISHFDWGNLWLLKSGKQVVTRPVSFSNGVEVKKLHVDSGIVNDINVEELDKEVLKTTENGNLEHAIFKDDVTVAYDVHLEEGAFINNHDPNQEFLLKNSSYPQRWSATKTFKNGAVFKHPIYIEKDVGKFDLSSMLRFGLEKDADSFKDEVLIVYGNLLAKEEPFNEHSINGKEWEDILAKYWFMDKEWVSTWKPKFESLHLKKGGSLMANKKVSGLDLAYTDVYYASKTKDQTWTGRIIFKNEVKANKLHATNLEMIYGLFQGINFLKLIESLVLRDTDQTINSVLNVDTLKVRTLEFTKNGSINRIPMQKGFFRNDVPSQVFIGTKTFNSIVTDDIDIAYSSPDISINGISFREWMDAIARVHGPNPQIFSGDVTFDDAQFLSNVRVLGTVDGIKFDRNHLMTLNKDQNVRGQIQFYGRTRSERNISPNQPSNVISAEDGIHVQGLYNGYNINHTFENIVKKSDNDTSPIVIKGSKIFSSPVTVNYIQVEKLYGDVNVTNVLRKIYAGSYIPDKLKMNFEKLYQNLIIEVKEAQYMAQRRVSFLLYYNLLQEISINDPLIFARRKTGTVSLYEKTNYEQRVGVMYKFNSTSRMYETSSDAVQHYPQVEGNSIIVREVDGTPFVALGFTSTATKESSVVILSEGAAYDEPVSVKQVIRKKSHLKLIEASFIKTSFNTNAFIPCLFSVYGALEKMVKHTIFVECTAGSKFVTVQNITLPAQALMIEGNVFNDASLLFIVSSELNVGGSLRKTALEAWRSYDIQLKFQRILKIPVYNPTSLDSIKMDDKLHVALASGTIKRSRHTGALQFYQYVERNSTLIEMQSVECTGVIKIKFHRLRSNELILYVLRYAPVNNIQVYKYYGLSGWAMIHSFTSEEGLDFSVIEFNSLRGYEHHLLVKKEKKLSIFGAIFNL